MRFLVFVFSCILITILHYFVITYINKKLEPKVVQEVSQKKLSVQMVQLKQIAPLVEKKVEKKKKTEKQEVKEQKLIKQNNIKETINKDAKRKVVKEKKDEISKENKKQKSETKKQVVEKKTPKIEKVDEKKIVNKKSEVVSKKVSKVENTKTNEKFEKFKKSYQLQLWSYLDKHKTYPVASKRLKEQGIVIINFRVLKTGIFKDIVLETSSGKKRLDKATLNMIIDLKKFKPFTEDVKASFIDISVPIEYKL